MNGFTEGYFLQVNSWQHINLISTCFRITLHSRDSKDVKVISRLLDRYVLHHQGTDQDKSVTQDFILGRAQGVRRTQNNEGR